MAKIDILNQKGEKVSDLTLADHVWGIEPNNIVLKKAISLQLASLRQGTHKTKTRAEVAGGGRKPYRQKGTGNARQGSIRAPHYRGGGIVFGVTPRDHGFNMNKKERSLALKSALVYKLLEEKLTVVDNLTLTSLRVKEGLGLISNLKLGGKILFITSDDAENLYMATRNLPKTEVILKEDINVLDIINAENLVLDQNTVKYVEEVLK